MSLLYNIKISDDVTYASSQVARGECIDCGADIWKRAKRCGTCNSKHIRKYNRLRHSKAKRNMV